MENGGYKKIAKEIKNNKPHSELIYSFQNGDNPTNILSNAKKERINLKKEILSTKYEEALKYKFSTEDLFKKYCFNSNNIYINSQIYKMPLIGTYIHIKLSGIEKEGIIIHESKQRIFFVMSNDKIKQFDKKGYNFFIKIGDKEYLIIGQNLKLSRLI